MLKNILIQVSISIAALGFATAGSVLLQNGAIASGTQRFVVDSAGTALPAESGYVATGTFTLTDGEIAAAFAAGDIESIVNDFAEFGAGVVGQGAFNIPGLFSVNTQTNNLTPGDAFVGNPIFAMIANQATAIDSEDFLIYKVPETADTPNFGPDAPTFSTTVDLSTAQSRDLIVGSIGGPVEVIFNGNPLTSETSLVLEAVPEPSTGVLTLSGVLALAMIRRRR